MKSWVTQLRKGLIEFCVINVLNDAESYGYEIVLQLKALEVMDVTESTVYPVLSRLKADGYLKVRSEPSSSGPPRRYFSLTKLGKQRLEQMNSYWDLLNESINTLRRPGGGK
ncbi:MAG: PadR family transcriptional regulator [Rhodopirellula sp.]|nr:PadR family transcriptional regulator [Rhodopirellula sp.]